jgi:hypothetical protein
MGPNAAPIGGGQSETSAVTAAENEVLREFLSRERSGGVLESRALEVQVAAAREAAAARLVEEEELAAANQVIRQCLLQQVSLPTHHNPNLG